MNTLDCEDTELTMEYESEQDCTALQFQRKSDRAPPAMLARRRNARLMADSGTVSRQACGEVLHETRATHG